MLSYCVGNALLAIMKQHLALYGNVQMVRGFCYLCQRWSLIIDSVIQCCDRVVKVAPTQTKRISEPEDRRRLPTKREREEILLSQDYRCLYCGVSLAGYVYYHGELKKVVLTWDHMAPYAYTRDNHHENFAATCQFCNSWKSSLIFRTVDEVRQYVQAKWEGEGRDTNEVSGVPEAVSEENQMAEVLQPEVPISSMGKKKPKSIRIRENIDYLNPPIGRKFGFYEVIGYGSLRHKYIHYWICRCKCGIEKEVGVATLYNGCRKCKDCHRNLVKKRTAP